MKETLYVLFGVLLTAAVGEKGSQPPWWTQGARSHAQSRAVHAHSGLTVVDPPKFSPPSRSSRRGGPLPGYLPLRPVPTARHPRWFGAETAPKPSFSRAPTQYERFPPFWSDDGHKARNRRPPPNSFRHGKKDCNPCNTVPWTPIFKSPVGLSSAHHGRELVPHVEVYPESSIQQPTILLPAQTPPLEPLPASALSSDLSPPAFESTHLLTSLPAGNSPVPPELLLPPQQQIPFPELSPVPVAPVHQSVAFLPDVQGLVPPAPPKASSNVVVTISEQDHPQDVHLQPNDQYTDQSSLIDAHAPQQHYYRPNNGGVDIVRSVPLAEYTSSIEYPFHYIQSAPYIDINTTPTNTTSLPETYEKPPQTGTQKVSDYLLSISQDPEQKKLIADSSPSASDKEHSQTFSSGPPHEPRYETSSRGLLDPNILTPPPLPPQLTQLLPTLDTAFLHPLFPVENRGIASAVNGALLPPPFPQPMNPTSLQPTETTVPPKKIQIIIPYTTINSQEYDQNALGSGLHPKNETFSQTQNRQTWPPIVVTEPTANQPRKAPAATQDFQQFKNTNSHEGTPSESNQVQHILASNIRDLLKKEMEPKSEQNIRLQKNIDNWTALEYSNHKVVGKKDPGEVISHAQAVTSMPGTSISHLLLPSKKIPDRYFTTAVSNFDDPATTPYPATSVSVDSKPFTTITRYSTVTRLGPSQRTTRLLQRTSTSKPDYENEIPEDTTPGQDWSNLKVSIAPGTNEKVYVVTPVTHWSNGRRSTRHIDTTEGYNSIRTTNAINLNKNYTTETPSTELFTRLEKVNQFQVVREEKLKTKNNKLYPKSTPLFRVKGNQTRLDKFPKFNKPKPIEKFFATSTTKTVPEGTSAISNTKAEDITTTSSTEFSKTTGFSSTELPSTTVPNLIFPFRNGGELPLEMAAVNFSATELMFRNTGQRKTLIKQVKVNNRRAKVGTNRGIARLIAKASSTEPTTTTSVTSTTDGLPSHMQVDVVYPHKKGETKKPTVYGQKKTLQKPNEKLGSKTSSAGIKADEPNITEDDREDINSLTSGTEGNETLIAAESFMPGGVFGETRPENSSRSLLDTIKLLRDFLADMSEEEESQEKHQQLGKVIQKIDATEKTKLDTQSTYKYNFPEYLTAELNLSRDEMNLIEGAMVELRRNKTKKKEQIDA